MSRPSDDPRAPSPRPAASLVVFCAVALAACGGGSGSAAPVPVTVSVTAASVMEGDSGTVELRFSVSLSAASTDPVQISYATTDGSATAGSDYEAVSGTLMFEPGAIAREVIVVVQGDSDAEADETLRLELSQPVNATLAQPSVTGTIFDDDTPPAEFGLASRLSNTSCIAPDRAVAATDIVLADAYPALPALDQPTKLLQAPGDDSLWFVLEKTGLVRVFDNAPGVAASDIWLDLSARVNADSEGGLLGMAFHPTWPAVPEVYLSYTGDPGGPMVSYFSRMRIADPGARPVSVTEERILRVDQDFNNHNGGDIAFGLDGLLYMGLGDGGGGGDPNGRAQDTTRLLGAFLRLDVLGVAWPTPGYRIPADNPFAGNALCGPGANAADCPEIYAWGFRNPWRWSFDRDTGQLWAADVGQNQWEEVDIVTLGGNYGWDCREGAHDFEPVNCVGGMLVEPVAEYDRSVGNAVTGGFVYRGAAVPGLAGVYVYGDFGSGRLLSLRADEKGGYEQTLLLDSGLNIAAFAEDQAGEIYLLDYAGDVRKIVPAGNGGTDHVPDLLAATGCVDPEDPAAAAPGLIPYDVNAPLWSDGAVKQRWIGLPDRTTIATDAQDDWIFPAGTVLMKHFELGGRLIETRLLMRHPDGVWAGYSYAWDEAQTGATRVRGGRVLEVEGQTWIYPSEAQCRQCHTEAAGVALGAETAQLNRSFKYPSTGITADQLATLDHIGLFDAPLGGSESLPALAEPFDAEASVDARARAYLHSNCSQCHRPGGPTPAGMDLRYATPLDETNSCGALPALGDLGIAGARIVAPGEPGRSVLLERMTRRDAVAMPPVGSNIVDSAGVALISTWIETLDSCN